MKYICRIKADKNSFNSDDDNDSAFQSIQLPKHEISFDIILPTQRTIK